MEDLRKKLSAKQLPYTGDSWGCASNLVILSVQCGQSLQEVKEAMRVCNGERYEMSHPDHVYSPYDCTGKAFGSNWRRLDRQSYEYGYTEVWIHSWAIDI